MVNIKMEKPASPAPSCLSMGSDASENPWIGFKAQRSHIEDTVSPAPSYLSMKSGISMDRPIMFGGQRSHIENTVSPAPSYLSMKSGISMDRPIMFGGQRSHIENTVSPAPSYLSMKSGISMDRPIMFGGQSPFAEDQFQYAVMSQLLRDPDSIPCGQTYCRPFIHDYLDKPDQTGFYTRPQNRKKRKKYPALDTSFTELIQKPQQSEFSPAPPGGSYYKPGDVACDLCTGSTLRAVKSCLICIASYCEQHVRPHYTAVALQRHTLVDATGDLKKRLCEQHHRVLEVFCKSDQTLICNLCALQHHRNHELDIVKSELLVPAVEYVEDTDSNRHAGCSDMQTTEGKALSEMANASTVFWGGNDKNKDCIDLPALGRPLHLGMLYDCRSDSYISDIKLWDRDTIASYQTSELQKELDVLCFEEDSLQKRFEALGVPPPLRASILAGLIQVGGAAGYLDHAPLSQNQDRVTLQCRSSTKVELLSHELLEREVTLDRTIQNTATHVVTGVLYGAQAFFVFEDSRISGNSGKDKAEMLRIMQTVTSSFSKQDILSKLKGTEKLNSLLYKCSLYCDIELPERPQDFNSALTVYESLSKLLGTLGEKEVPVRVHLHPLITIDPLSARVKGNLSEELLSRVQDVVEHCRLMSRKSRDMMVDFFNTSVFEVFPEMKSHLQLFIDLLQRYQSRVQNCLGQALRSVQQGKVEGHQDLSEALKRNSTSPFCPQAIQQWLRKKQVEMDALKICQRKNILIVKSVEDLEQIVGDVKTDSVVCFTHDSAQCTDPYLSALQKHLHSVPSEHQDISCSSFLYSPLELCFSLLLFCKYVEESSKNNKLRFIILSVPGSTCPDASIHLYQQGRLVSNAFQPVSKPYSLSITAVNQNEVTVCLLEYQHERSKQYQVEYRAVTPGSKSSSKKGWSVMNLPDHQEVFVVSGLQSNTVYQMRHRAVDVLTMEDFSWMEEVKTKPRPRPGQITLNDIDGSSISIRWQKPSDVEENFPVLKYRVEHMEIANEKWFFHMTEGPECNCTVTQRYSSCNRVRVCAVYGEKDVSEPSEELEIHMNFWVVNLSKVKTSTLLEVLKQQPDKRPLELRGCPGEESEMRTFLQCLPYISQLRLFLGFLLQKNEAVKFLLNLVEAIERDSEAGLSATKYLSSLCSYSTFPFDPNSHHFSFQCDFLLGLYSHVKDYENQTQRTVLPALLPIYQAAPPVWVINLSKVKTSTLLEVLKLQPDKRPLELRGCSGEENEMRTFLQCLPCISQLRFNDKHLDYKEATSIVLKMTSLGAEHSKQKGEANMKSFLSVFNIENFVKTYFRTSGYDTNRMYIVQSDFILGLYSHVKDYENQAQRTVLPILLPIYQAAPPVLVVNLSEVNTSTLLEVLKLLPDKRPLELRGCSGEESEMRTFLQCLPYISQLRFSFGFVQQKNKEAFKFLLNLVEAIERDSEAEPSATKYLSSVCSYSTFPFDPNSRNFSVQCDFLLGLYSHVKDYENQTQRTVLPALLPIYQAALPVLVVNPSEVNTSTLLEVLKLQSDKRPLELRGCSGEESEVKFLQCLPCISQLSTQHLSQMAVQLHEAQDEQLTERFLEKTRGTLSSRSQDSELLQCRQKNSEHVTCGLKRSKDITDSHLDLVHSKG